MAKLKYNDKEIDLIICNSFFKRFMGVMFKKKKINYALGFFKCNSIHTFFCKQAIDIIMTDNNNKIVYFKRNVLKNKIVFFKEAKNTFETPNNYFNDLKIGTYLKMEDL